MLKNDELKEVLDTCLETGGDFAEIFFEDTIRNSIEMNSKQIRSVSTQHIHGAGIRILKELQEVYGYTNDCSLDGLLKLANTLKGSYQDRSLEIEIALQKRDLPFIHDVKRYAKTISNAEKIKYLEIASEAAMSYSDKVLQVIAYFHDETQEVTVVNSKGVYTSDIRHRPRVAINVVAKDGDKMESAFDSYGGNFDFEYFDRYDFAEFGRNAATTAVGLLDAEEMVGGVYDVVIHNAFGGVIFHEACGHSLEATAVAKNLSVFSNKLGQKIASDCVTAIDDGTIRNEWGSITVDDEGHPSQKNVLIKDGILTGYMIDYRNSRRMNMEPTGSSRRQSYRFSPTSRMTNTFIENGPHTPEEIIGSVKYGLFAKKLGGGSVNPATGEYNFSVSEGYLIEDGNITRAVKGATLIGSGAQTLLNIDMVGNNRTFGYGMCGSASGSINTCVGQPTIRVRQMTVGGTGGKE